MFAELPNTLAGARDQAILLLGLALVVSASLATSWRTLSVTDIHDDEGLIIDVRYSKTADARSPCRIATHLGEMARNFRAT